MLLARRRAAVLFLPVLLAFPAAAGAAPFKDKVITGSLARAAQAEGSTQRYPTGDGAVSVRVTLAPSYTGDPGGRPGVCDVPRHPPARPRAGLAEGRGRAVLAGREGVRRRAGRRHPRLLWRQRPDDDRPGRPGGRQRRLGQLRDRPRVRAPHRRAPLQRAAERARLRPQAVVLLRAGAATTRSTAGSLPATRAPTTSPTRARRGQSPTRG